MLCFRDDDAGWDDPRLLALCDLFGAHGLPLDLYRPFVHVGPVVRELLAQRYGSVEAANTFGGRALTLGNHCRVRLDAVLSHRELAVLAMLPSLQSLDEIAADLTVSVNTVKTHVRAIYVKLGVTNRRDAVLVAREHGLA